jgi:HemK-like putative methylase
MKKIVLQGLKRNLGLFYRQKIPEPLYSFQ